jgi:DNA-binding CsgD family transcriptional regulator
MVALPWDQINAFLLYSGGAENRKDLFDRALTGIGDIIPWDVGIGVFDRDIRCVACGGWDRRTFEHYNTHYYSKVPFILYDERGVARRGKDVVQWGQMPDSEFIRDFARPLGLDSGLSPFRPAWPLNISVQRSKDSAPFTKRDCEILDIINGHFHNYLTLLARRGEIPDIPPADEKAAVKETLRLGYHLTEREMQLLEGLCDGLSNKALAANLFVSERTVKAHLTSIFYKTGCRSRMELVALVHRAF